MISLTEELQGEELLDVFKEDPNYLENEDKYKQIRAEILGEGSSDEDEDGDDEEDEDEDEDEEEQQQQQQQGGTVAIQDMTGTNLVAFRRTIYLVRKQTEKGKKGEEKRTKERRKQGRKEERKQGVIQKTENAPGCCLFFLPSLRFFTSSTLFPLLLYRQSCPVPTTKNAPTNC